MLKVMKWKILYWEGKLSFRRAWMVIWATLICLLGLFGAWIIFYGTALSPWGRSDSVEYLVSARSMLRGIGIGYFSAKGIFIWISLHPPFYPIILGAVSRLGLDLVDAARWLDIILFALSIVLTGFLFWRYSNSPSYGLLAGLLLLVFLPTLTMFTGAMSEPLFIILSVLHGLLLIWFFRTARLRWLLLSALAAGLASLTRYIGAALIGAGVFSIFLFFRGKWSGRIWRFVLYFAVACLPLGLWFGWSYFGANHSLAGRSAQLGLGGLTARLQPFRLAVVETIWKWLPLQDKLSGVPYRGQLAILVLASVVLIVLTIIAYRQFSSKQASDGMINDLYLFGIFGLYALGLLVFLAVTTAFTSLPPTIDDHMLLPIYISGVISLLAAFSICCRRWLSGPWMGLKIIPWLVAVLCVFQYVPASTAYLSTQHVDKGLRTYENTALINAVRDLPANVPVISTWPNVLLLWADRPAYLLTVDFPPEFLLKTGPYGSDPQDPLQKIFREDGAVLVDFNDLSPQFIQKYGKDSVPRLDLLIKSLVVYKQTPEGVIYYYPKPGS